MDKLGTYVLTEWRLFIRGRIVWMLLISAAFVVIIHYDRSHGLQHYEASVIYSLPQYIGSLSLFALLYGVYIMGRDQQHRADELLGCLPNSMAIQCVGRYMVAVLPFSILALGPLAGYVVLSWHSSMSVDPFVAGALGSNVVPMFYSVAIGMCARVFTGSILSYGVALLIWYMHNHIQEYVDSLYSSVYEYLFVYIPGIVELSGQFDFVLGFMVDTGFWVQKGVFVMLTIMILFIMLAVVACKNNERFVLRYLSAAFLSLICGGWFAVQYLESRLETIHAYHQFVDQVYRQDRVYTENTDLSPMSEAVSVVDYRLDGIYLDHGELRFEAEMTVQSNELADRLETLHFTISPFFQVTDVRVNKQAMSYRQEWNHVSIPLQTSLLEDQNTWIVTLVYQGKVADYRDHYFGLRSSNKNLIPFQLANARYLYLTNGWYPIPGRWPLYSYGNPVGDSSPYSDPPQFLRDLYPSLQAANYELRLDYPLGINIVSNLNKVAEEITDQRQQLLFRGEQLRGAVLFGGRLREVVSLSSGSFAQSDPVGQSNPEVEQTKIIVHQLSNRSHYQDIAELYHRLNTDIGQLIDHSLRIPNLTLIPINHSKMLGQYSITDQGSMWIHELYPGSGVYSLLDSFVSHSRISIIREFMKHVVDQNDELFTATLTAYFAHAYYGIPYGELKLSFVSRPTPFSTPGTTAQEIFEEITELLKNYTDAEVRDIMKKMYLLLIENSRIPYRELIEKLQ